jgi:hypothetical protein
MNAGASRGVLIVAAVAIVLFLTVYALSRLEVPAQTESPTQSPTYAECGGIIYNLIKTPFACGTGQTGMQSCRRTTTTNGMVVIMISEIAENQTCS